MGGRISSWWTAAVPTPTATSALAAIPTVGSSASATEASKTSQQPASASSDPPSIPSEYLDHLPAETVDSISSFIESYSAAGASVDIQDDAAHLTILQQCAAAAPGLVSALNALGAHAPLVGVSFAILNAAGKKFTTTGEANATYEEFHDELSKTGRLMLRVVARRKANASFAQQPLDDLWAELRAFLLLVMEVRSTGGVMRLWTTGDYKPELSRIQSNIQRIHAALAEAVDSRTNGALNDEKSPGHSSDGLVHLPPRVVEKVASLVESYSPAATAVQDTAVQSFVQRCTSTVPDLASDLGQITQLGQHAALMAVVLSVLDFTQQLKLNAETSAAYNKLADAIMTAVHLLAQSEKAITSSAAKEALTDFWAQLSQFVALLLKVKGEQRILQLWTSYHVQLVRIQSLVQRATMDLALELGWDAGRVSRIVQEVTQMREVAQDTKRGVLDEAGYALAVQKAFTPLLGVADALQQEPADHPLGLLDVFVPQDVLPTDASYSTELDLPVGHVTLLKDSAQLERLSPDVVQRMAFSNSAKRSVMEVLADSMLRLVVILGSPNSGKTSALRAHALQWAMAAVAGATPVARPFPLLVELKQYANDRDKRGGWTLLDCMADGGAARVPLSKAALQNMLQSDREVLLMLDGLDEIYDVEVRTSVLRDIKKFVLRYSSPSNRVVLTSRTVGYHPSELVAFGFRHFTLQPLSPEQIKLLVQRWHTNACNEKETGMREQREWRVLNAVDKVPSIALLATNPLLLTMIAILTRDPDLPHQRVALYEKCSTLLLDRWNTEEAVAALGATADPAINLFTTSQKAALLMDLAFSMQQEEMPLGNLVQRDVLEGIIREHVVQRGLSGLETELLVQALMKQLRDHHYIICWLGAESYAFVHRTFLEFFCAKHVQQRWKRDEIDSDWLVLLFQRRALEDTWHEVLVLVSGMLPSTALYACLEALMDAGEVYLAAECLQQFDVKERKVAAEKRLREALDPPSGDGLSLAPSPSRELHTSRFHWLGRLWPDERTRLRLENEAESGHFLAAAAAIRALAQTWKDERCLLLLQRVAASEKEGNQAAVEALDCMWDVWGADRGRLFLESLVRADAPRETRGAVDCALDILVQRWDDDRTRLLLEEIAWRSYSAVSVLLRRWKDDRARALVQNLVQAGKLSDSVATHLLSGVQGPGRTVSTTRTAPVTRIRAV